MGKHIYHYCAMRQKTAGKIMYYDGLVIRNHKLQKPIEYESLKKQIDEEFGDSIIITSLSYLGVTEE